MKQADIRHSKLMSYLVPRIFITVTTYLLLFSNVRDISFLIGQIDFGYGRLSEALSLCVSSLIVMSLIWTAYGFLVNVASSLGYKDRKEREFSIVGNTGTINFSADDNEEDRRQKVRSYEVSFAKYEQGNPLMALWQSRSRIYSHIERLQNSSIVNLFIGIAIAFIGILTIGSTFFEIEKYADKSQGFNTVGFLTFALLPRLSIALIVQVFSFFFLIMYRSNVNDVRYFQNEITNIDSIAAAISCLKGDSDNNTKSVIGSLLKTERNRLASKNQKIINPANDEEIMQRLSKVENELGKGLRQIKGPSGAGA